MQPRRDLKVIDTSATIDAVRFAAHFGGAPVVNVVGRAYPVEVRYRAFGSESLAPDDSSGRQFRKGESDSDSISVLDGILAACDEIARERPMGDTLVFLLGERENRDRHQAPEHRQYRHTEVLPQSARLFAADRERVFNTRPPRRLVLANKDDQTKT